MEAKKRSLPAFIKICTITKAWDILAEHILQLKHNDLESISHYTIGEPAKKLSKDYPMAAAKLFRAQGIRILNSKKSKRAMEETYLMSEYQLVIGYSDGQILYFWINFDSILSDYGR
ncbi:MAG TPA: hypothetical protein ENH01_04285 [Nitrospirae bacterium]|nr:hypothetical protein [Nitrospirota bacterium]